MLRLALSTRRLCGSRQQRRLVVLPSSTGDPLQVLRRDSSRRRQQQQQQRQERQSTTSSSSSTTILAPEKTTTFTKMGEDNERDGSDVGDGIGTNTSVTNTTTRTSSSTTTPLSSAGASSTTAIRVNTKRSFKEIQQLVQRRVVERNQWKVYGKVLQSPMPSLGFTLKTILWQMPTQMPIIPSCNELDETFPIYDMNWKQLQQSSSSSNGTKKNIQLTWLGHASVLIQLGGYTILTDPIFSERCSPSQWFGPKRYRSIPCTIQELYDNVSIDVIIISHNHYDHLDYTTIKQLYEYDRTNKKNKTKKIQWIVPLGLQTWFRKHICTNNDVQNDSMDIYELDWYEYMNNNNNNPQHHQQQQETCSTSTESTTSSSSLKITSLPSRHWSNRTGDRDKTLWCGYGIEVTTTTTTSNTTTPQSPSSSSGGGGDSESESVGPTAVKQDTPRQDNNQDFTHTNTTKKTATAATAATATTTKTTQKVLFPGDTAWFDELSDILGPPPSSSSSSSSSKNNNTTNTKNVGYGPWDVATIPIGAYEPREFMKYSHINVKEAIAMKDAIHAKFAVPIHWGTFPLTTEPPLEPRDQLIELMKRKKKNENHNSSSDCDGDGEDDDDDDSSSSSFEPWHIGETKQF